LLSNCRRSRDVDRRDRRRRCCAPQGTCDGTDLGHEPAEAADGAAALAWLVRRRADAVLLDLRMPGMDGIEVLRRIRALADPPPVAVLTAVPTSANTIEAMRLGAADHVAKPIGREDLLALLGFMQHLRHP
jgi:DNA-binding response OmpR family regulator